MHRGYTKRWRKRWDKGYHKDHLMWVIMDYFIDFAPYKDKEVFVKGIGDVKLKRGQWIFTYRELAAYMGVNPRRIRTCIGMLNKTGFSGTEATHQYTILTIKNYDKYQPNELLTDTQIDTEPTQGRHSVDTPFNTKKVKKVNKVNNYSTDFESFWKAYPKKIAKSKAYQVWKRIKPDKVLLLTILTAVETQKRSDQWKKDHGQYIPHPTTWLNGGRWEDETEVSVAAPKSRIMTPEELEEKRA